MTSKTRKLESLVPVDDFWHTGYMYTSFTGPGPNVLKHLLHFKPQTCGTQRTKFQCTAVWEVMSTIRTSTGTQQAIDVNNPFYTNKGGSLHFWCITPNWTSFYCQSPVKSCKKRSLWMYFPDVLCPTRWILCNDAC